MTLLPRSLERLACCSWLIYATRSEAPDAKRVKTLILDIKEDRRDPSSGRPWSALTIERALTLNAVACRNTFASDPLLVPVPGSGLTKPNTVWSARRLSEELVRHGLGGDVIDIVHRTTAVNKSAGSRQRPSLLEHYTSLTVRPRLKSPAALVLVDDVVTSGTTLMACAMKLAEAVPGVPVTAFAVARVQSEGDPLRVFMPALEFITLSGQRCARA